VVPTKRLAQYHEFAGLKAFGRIEATREIDGKVETDVRIFALSRKFSPQALLATARAALCNNQGDCGLFGDLLLRPLNVLCWRRSLFHPILPRGLLEIVEPILDALARSIPFWSCGCPRFKGRCIGEAQSVPVSWDLADELAPPGCRRPPCDGGSDGAATGVWKPWPAPRRRPSWLHGTGIEIDVRLRSVLLTPGLAVEPRRLGTGYRVPATEPENPSEERRARRRGGSSAVLLR
jgi:hypothetical protein